MVVELVKFIQEIIKLKKKVENGFPLKGSCDLCKDRVEILS